MADRRARPVSSQAFEAEYQRERDAAPAPLQGLADYGRLADPTSPQLFEVQPNGGPLNDLLKAWNDPRPFARPNVAESFIPVVGSGWETLADLHDGDYAGAAFNGAMTLAEVIPAGVVATRGARAAKMGVTALKKGSKTSNASAKMLRARGFAGKGEEIHHSIRLDGTPRNVPDWRNNPMFLKVLPKATHRRIHTRWQGAPRFDPVRQVWYGTTDWMKAVPTVVGAYLSDAVENVTRPFEPSPPPAKPRR